LVRVQPGELKSSISRDPLLVYTRAMRRRVDPKLVALSRVPLFAGFGKRDLAAVGRIADELDVPAGKVLIREGELGRQFFILLEGDADVRRRGRRINTLKRGDFFGEISLLSDQKTTATVTATTDARVALITRPSFKRLLRDSSTVKMSVIAALVKRVPTD
jgi:CRP/FNR family transcriptional regulator, cyclic AMP receptor protein